MRRYWPAVASGALAIIAILQWLGVGARLPLWFAVVAWGALGTVGAAALAVIVAGAVLASQRSRRVVNVATTGTVLAGLLLLAAFRIVDTAPAVAPESVAAPAGDVVVMEWNAQQQPLNSSTVDELIGATKPDVAVFAEMFPPLPGSRDAEEGIRAPDGYQLLGVDGIAVTLLIRTEFGQFDVTQWDRSSLGSGFTADARDPATALQRVVAAHVTQPSLRHGTEWWESGLDWVGDQCVAPRTIAVGDFNAVDAALRDGLGSCALLETPLRTWPTWLPSALSIEIDHVMASPAYEIGSSALIDISSSISEHRPIVVSLRVDDGLDEGS